MKYYIQGNCLPSLYFSHFCCFSQWTHFKMALSIENCKLLVLYFNKHSQLKTINQDKILDTCDWVKITLYAITLVILKQLNVLIFFKYIMLLMWLTDSRYQKTLRNKLYYNKVQTQPSNPTNSMKNINRLINSINLTQNHITMDGK